jgi:hypothetical protein
LLLFVFYRSLLRWSVALVGLNFKSYLSNCIRSFFAPAELRLFSTVLRGRAVDLFLNSRMAALAWLPCGNLNRASLCSVNFLQSWRECGFRVAPLHVARGGMVAIDVAVFRGDGLRDIGFG